MKKICIVCGKRMISNLCDCGFDDSKNYDENRTLAYIPENCLSLYQMRKNYESGNEKSVMSDDELLEEFMKSGPKYDPLVEIIDADLVSIIKDDPLEEILKDSGSINLNENPLYEILQGEPVIELADSLSDEKNEGHIESQELENSKNKNKGLKVGLIVAGVIVGVFILIILLALALFFGAGSHAY